ncbi:hypothetical protein Tco_0430957 [Tanacetum coccineum]
MVYGNDYNRVNYNYTTNRTHPNAQRNMVPRAVLIKTGLKSFNTARTVNTAHPKSTVYSAKPMSRFSKAAQSTEKVNTVRPKAVNTARPNSAVVNTVSANQANVVKASACWVRRPTKLDSASITLKKHNYIDARGRSKYMTANISYFLDFQEFDGGYVTFGGGVRGGKITGKGTLKMGKLDFQDVFFVKELRFNLFSVKDVNTNKSGCITVTTMIKAKHIEYLMLKTSPLKYCLKGGYLCQAWMKGHVISKVGDEAVHKELGDRMERAATTDSSLETEQDSDAQTRFETTSKKSNDPPFSRVNTLGSREDSMKLMELMAHCTKLSELVRKRKERYGKMKNR